MFVVPLFLKLYVSLNIYAFESLSCIMLFWKETEDSYCVLLCLIVMAVSLIPCSLGKL